MTRPTMDTPTYIIRNVWDFLKVPAERRAECLREFAIALDMAEATRLLLDSLLVNAGAAPSQLTDAFTWFDDDKHEATVHVEFTSPPTDPEAPKP